MDRYIEQNLEGYLGGTLDADRQSEFARRLAASDEYTREMVARFADHGRMLRESLSTGDAMEPAPGFYARVVRRIDSQRVTDWWAAFLEPQFTTRLAVASLALLFLLGVTMVTTEEDPLVAAATPIEIMAEPASELASSDFTAEMPPEGRDIVLVDLATYQE
jgi:anti-sigma factor RsiW